MLVLTRKQGERIVIGHDIHVTVLKIAGNRVRLGIAGPRATPIHRAEVDQRIREECPTACWYKGVDT
jgi:carbon storage regulator